MREILFRGKRISNGQLVLGDLECNKISNKSFIHTYTSDGKFCRQFEVDPATVGQYTGLTDQNGTRIFEGDVLKIENRFKPEGFTYIVQWSDTAACYFGKGISCPDRDMAIVEGAGCVVVGNIHDTRIAERSDQ